MRDSLEEIALKGLRQAMQERRDDVAEYFLMALERISENSGIKDIKTLAYFEVISTPTN